MLSGAGWRIDTSFVSPKWVPQMADAAEVMAGIHRAPDVSYAVLTPNMQAAGANTARADEIASRHLRLKGSASQRTLLPSRKALNALLIMEAARNDGIPVRGYVSMVTDSPFDGATPPSEVARVAARLFAMGVL